MSNILCFQTWICIQIRIKEKARSGSVQNTCGSETPQLLYLSTVPTVHTVCTVCEDVRLFFCLLIKYIINALGEGRGFPITLGF